MQSYELTSLVTNYYEATCSDLFLKQSIFPSLYVVTFSGEVPIAPAYPEGYLSIDLLTIDFLVWSGHHRVFVQCAHNRRYFELSFADSLNAVSFTVLLRDLKGEELIEQIRTPLEMDIISSSWPIGRIDVATMEKEPLGESALMRALSVSQVHSQLPSPGRPSDVNDHVPNPSDPSPSDCKAKPRTTSKVCQSCEETLEHIFQTGIYSDLTVVAGDYHFNVHKAVVCPRSQFFAKALESQFLEANLSSVTVDETPAVIEAVLRYMYGQEITLSRPPLSTTFTKASDSARRNTITLMIDVYIAADKYGISHLQDIMVHAVKDHLPWICKPQTLTTLAHYVYESTPYHEGRFCKMREAVAAFVQDHLKAVLQDPEGAATMFENHSLMFDILQRSAEVKETPNKLAASVKRAREEARDEVADQRRKSLRPKQRVPGSYRLRLRSWNG